MGREAAARVAALRENDYGEYLRLAQHTKDARLRTLLGKTDSIIAELGLKARRPSCECPASVLLSAKPGAVPSVVGPELYCVKTSVCTLP